MKNYIEKEIIVQVPLNYTQNEQDSQYSFITLFARDIYDQANENAEILLFFNGGPGFSCIREWQKTDWIMEALKKYRIILLDQRGTERSQLIDLSILDKFSSAESLSDYLTHFRADNIVRDAEFLREKVLKRKKITIMGQSFGGFVIFSYLSLAPKSLRGAIITAGIPPIASASVKEIYQALTKVVCQRNEKFYALYPKDKIKIERIVALLKEKSMPVNGEFLTLERFLDLGWLLGQENGFETFHYILDEAFCDEKMTKLSWHFAKNIMQNTAVWEINPLYSLFQEAIYCENFASEWASDAAKKEINEFSLENSAPYFSGEMVRKNMFQDYMGLQQFEAAALFLAQKKDWPLLYDLDKLKNNTVPVEALLMTDDFYVNYDLARKSVTQVNNINVWKHKTWQHDALRKHGKKVMSTLMKRLEKR